jgi:glutathione synthase/RimK-type ligase-like ATP-grasp enzyme
MHFTLVTYSKMPDLDPDDRLLADALRERGHECRAAVWDDPAVDWSAAGVVVIRSTWDYHLKFEQFLSWVKTVEDLGTLWNPADLIRWNSNKKYLLDLEKRGAPITPTVLYSPGDKPPALPSEWNELIVKPTVGLATHGVKRAAKDSPEFKQILAEAKSALLVQPYLKSVVDYGERALIFIGGKYSHAVQKAPFQSLQAAGLAGEKPIEAAPDEVAVAKDIVKLIPGPHLYARVDIIRDSSHNPVLLELELVEPSLFLAMQPHAATALADVLVRANRDHHLPANN